MRMPAETGGDFKPAPAGTHRAVCVSVVDLGSHMEQFQGQPAKMKRKVRVSWELSDEPMDNGKPFIVGKKYTLSSNEKATFRLHLEAWRGKRFEPHDFGPGGFEPKRLLGAPCLLNITHDERDGKTYANVAGISPMVKGMDKPAPAGDLVYFSMEEPADPDGKMAAAFASLPEYWQNEIKKSPEFADWSTGAPPRPTDRNPPPPDDSDIPF